MTRKLIALDGTLVQLQQQHKALQQKYEQEKLQRTNEIPKTKNIESKGFKLNLLHMSNIN